MYGGLCVGGAASGLHARDVGHRGGDVGLKRVVG